jgi:thiol-disulfide isomerase/thioredoxin
VYAVIGLGLVAVLVIGLTQSGGDAPEGELVSKAPPAEEAEAAYRGAPPALAALYDEANELVPGGKDEFERRLDDLRGHPVVVNFWASWCGPCRLEFPIFQASAVDYAREVGFLGVNSGDNADNARTFLADFPITYPSVEDQGGRTLQSIGLRGLPITVLYDREGKIAFRHQGYYRDEADLAEDIGRYLDVAPPQE